MRFDASANLTIKPNMHFDACQFHYLAKYTFWRVPFDYLAKYVFWCVPICLFFARANFTIFCACQFDYLAKFAF